MADNSSLAMGMQLLGYKDYIASRFLLNNEYFDQAVILASSAVEKYLKAILLIQNIQFHGHLHEDNKLINQFQKTEYWEVIQKRLDPNFLLILCKAYRYRYYDTKTVTESDTIGFVVNQFLCEFDSTIGFLDKFFILNDQDGNPVNTALRRAIAENNADLFRNHYMLNKIDKIEFMRRPSNVHATHVNPKFLGNEIRIQGKNIIPLYDDNIWIVQVTNK